MSSLQEVRPATPPPPHSLHGITHPQLSRHCTLPLFRPCILGGGQPISRTQPMHPGCNPMHPGCNPSLPGGRFRVQLAQAFHARLPSCRVATACRLRAIGAFDGGPRGERRGHSCNPMCSRLQPLVFRLQPHVYEAATLCAQASRGTARASGRTARRRLSWRLRPRRRAKRCAVAAPAGTASAPSARAPKRAPNARTKMRTKTRTVSTRYYEHCTARALHRTGKTRALWLAEPLIRQPKGLAATDALMR